jgi:hypothetical protein
MCQLRRDLFYPKHICLSSIAKGQCPQMLFGWVIFLLMITMNRPRVLHVYHVPLTLASTTVTCELVRGNRPHR